MVNEDDWEAELIALSILSVVKIDSKYFDVLDKEHASLMDAATSNLMTAIDLGDVLKNGKRNT